MSIAQELPFWFNNSLTKAAPFLVSGFAPWCARIRCDSESYCDHLSHGKTRKLQRFKRLRKRDAIAFCKSRCKTPLACSNDSLCSNSMHIEHPFAAPQRLAKWPAISIAEGKIKLSLYADPCANWRPASSLLRKPRRSAGDGSIRTPPD